MNDPDRPDFPEGASSRETLHLERTLRSLIEQLDAGGFSVAAAHASQALDALLIQDGKLKPTSFDDGSSS
ncbi:MAG: hypothetical protein V2I43_11720 [Parvularcula sp.]|nr:hypothetical protein [Parvularcula sp.]